MTSPDRDPLRMRVAWAGVPRLSGVVGRSLWRLEVSNGNGFPQPPYVIAANHHSFLDPFLIAAAHRRKIRFLALQDLFGNYRWVDFSLGAFDAIPIKRGAVALGPLRSALSHLSSNGVVGIFPEGTRYSSFHQGRVRSGAAWLAVRSGVPLVPVAIRGSEGVLGPDNKLHRGRIALEVGPALRPDGPGRAEVGRLMAEWSNWIVSHLDD